MPFQSQFTTNFKNLRYGDLFKKLNLIPDGFRYESNFRLKDMFNSEIWIYHHDNLNGSGLHFSAIGYKFQPSTQGTELCRNIAITAKENASDLYALTTTKYNNNGTYNQSQDTLYGDKYCDNSEKPCMRNLTLDKIAELCNICNEQNCDLYVEWQ